jgi:23S rRNA (cytosine1962-C5)-methyltransferase
VPIGVRLETGTWVRVRCGNWAGYGLWDAEGPIAIRIYSERQVPDTAWLREQVRAAWDLRAPVRATGTTAYRWLFGEGDGLPGLTVDRYGEYAVAAAYSSGAATLLAPLAEALAACDPALRGVVQRLRPDDDEEAEPVADPRRMTRDGRQRRIGLLWGQEPPKQLIANEHGLQFEVDLQAGQKTGLFLDQRENRRYLEQISADRRVLNCFAYTGAFSMYALRGGASEAVSVDIGKGLAESAANNLRLSGLDQRRHRFITADCFELLNRYAEQGQQFDIVILDPPSFAKSKQNRYAALRAYTKLNALGLRCVAEGGILISSSCTSQVGPEAFRELLGVAAAQADRRLQIIHEAGHASDHPVPAHFPEGRYLKFIAAQVREVP